MRKLKRDFKIGLFLAGPVFGLTFSLLTPTAGAASVAQFSRLPWNWDPWILASLALAVVAYVRGLNRLDHEARSCLFGWSRWASFTAGIAAFFLALISPIDALDDQLFSAHMLQHLVLLLIAPPLLVYGRPVVACLWAFPLNARRVLGRLWMKSGLQYLMHKLMSPLSVWMLCSGALWFWHLPGPYGWALQHESVHAFEHICFVSTSLMFWTLVLEPYGGRRLSYGGALLFVATYGLENGLLGALLTLATRPLYTSYLGTTAAWGLSPLEDQQLSGVIMWIPASLVHLTALCVLFVVWMHAAEHQAIASARGHSQRALRHVALFGLLLVSISGICGCGTKRAEPPWRIVDANASRGPSLIQKYGCGSCHTISGIPTAMGRVGPPLEQFGERVYIAGMLHNNPDNLIKWLRYPQSVTPGNAMPDMQITEQDARDIAAYLYAPFR